MHVTFSSFSIHSGYSRFPIYRQRKIDNVHVIFTIYLFENSVTRIGYWYDCKVIPKPGANEFRKKSSVPACRLIRLVTLQNPSENVNWYFISRKIAVELCIINYVSSIMCNGKQTIPCAKSTFFSSRLFCNLDLRSGSVFVYTSCNFIISSYAERFAIPRRKSARPGWIFKTSCDNKITWQDQ